MQNISNLCHKPITEMPLDELGYILLERFSEQGPLFNVHNTLTRLRDKSDEESFQTSYNIMLEAFQWLCNESLVMKYLARRDEYCITRKRVCSFKTMTTFITRRNNK